MAADDTFFQFPLCLLSLPETQDRTQAMMYYAIIEHGRKAAVDMKIADLVDAIDGDGLPGRFRRTDRTHLELAYGNKLIVITGGDAVMAAECRDRCAGHVHQYERKHGRDAVCRMRRDLLFSVRDGGMTWRDFSTLAAVYSIIGGKPFPVLVHRSMIQARGLGYKSPSIMQAEIAGRDDVSPLTEKQIRLTLDSLECAGWFARVQASARKVYFSNRMTRDDMIAHLEKSATAQGRAINNRMRDRAVMARLAALKKGAEK
jgi:hypothetical protein